MSDTEEAPQKRKASDKQLENLRKGMAVLKAKREALAKEKQEVQTKIEKGELPEDTPIPKQKQKPRNTIVPKPLKVEPEPEPEVKPVKKPRKAHISKVSQQLDAFKQEMLQMVQKPAEVKEVEKVVEKPVEKIIQKERVVTGSEMLNKIFNL
jgi:vacuolar-type H+-ATPase subunit D/Vma8